MDNSNYGLKPEGIFTGIIPFDRQLWGMDIYLKPLVLKDADQLQALMIDQKEELSDWYHGLTDKVTRGMVLLFIKQEQEEAARGERLDLGIFLYDGSLIGKVSIHSVAYGIERAAGLSYWISNQHRLKGYATQAVACICSFAFEEANLHRLWALVEPVHLVSHRILNKLGFRIEGLVKSALFIKKQWRDMQHLSLLDEEYDSYADDWIEKGWLGTE